MSTIIEVLNVILDNKDKLTEVARDDAGKIYFRYAGPRVWTVELTYDGEVVVRVYPLSDGLAAIPLSRIASNKDWDADSETKAISQALQSHIIYSSDEWTSREAKATFKDLYKRLLERSHHVDKYFEEIISGSPQRL